MPLTATTVKTWQDDATAYWAASTPIDGENVEFTASTPLTGTDDAGNAVTYTSDQLAAGLQSAMSVAVNAQLATQPQPLNGVMSGTVSL